MLDLIGKIPVSGELRIVIAIATIIVVTLIAAVLSRVILAIIVKQLTSRTKNDLDDRLLSVVRSHVYYVIILIGLASLFDYLDMITDDLVPKLFSTVDGIIWVVGVSIGVSMIIRLISAVLQWYGEVVASRTETDLDDEFVPLLDRVLKIIVVVLGLLIVLDHFGVDIMGLVAVLGVGSLAVALAAQETIANMIGGFVIMIDRPFRQGDRVRLNDGTVCIVNQIGIRSTKFLTFDNTLIIIPNADLMKSTIHNLTYPQPQVRVRVEVGIGYDSDINTVRTMMLDEADKHPAVLKEPDPSFFFLEFGDSALNVSLRCRVSDISEQFRTASELREQILNRFRAENIEIPFPQRVISMVDGNTLPSLPAKADQLQTDSGIAQHRGQIAPDIDDDDDGGGID